jgi:hypothetical protein
MDALFITLGIAFTCILVAVAMLGVSWLITGKSSLKPGSCGRDPHKKRDSEECGKSASCGLCEKHDQETKR